MKEQNPTRKDESIKTDNEICEMCAKESEELEKNIATGRNRMLLSLQDHSPFPG